MIAVPYKYVLTAITLSFVAGVGYKTGQYVESNAARVEKVAALQVQQKAYEKSHSEYVSEVEKQRKADALAYQQLSNERKLINEKYNAALDSLNSFGGLRIPAAVCDNRQAAESSTATGIDERAAGTVALPEQVTQDLFELAKEADGVSAQLRALQLWVIENGK